LAWHGSPSQPCLIFILFSYFSTLGAMSRRAWFRRCCGAAISNSLFYYAHNGNSEFSNYIL
jgi:hypothetical protein